MSDNSRELERIAGILDDTRIGQDEQTEQIERLADQLEIQNALLFELVRQQERRAEIEMGRPPDESRTPKATATAVQDGILHLAERIDIDVARRYADER